MGVATRVGGGLPADDAQGPVGRDAADEAAAPAAPAASAGSRPAAPPDPGAEVDDASYARVAAVLRAARGLALDAFKPRWIRRRIALRVRARGCADAGQYAALVERDAAEVERLNAALTITVTQFFRNLSTFERIAELVLPALFAQAGQAGLRVWSLGCASGEEPYSVAMLVRDRFPDRLAGTRVTIVGIDRDPAALDRAAGAVYDRDRLGECPEPLVARYFTRTPAGRFELARDVRQMVTFRRANLFEPAEMPHGPADLILCRNVLIYFARGEQERLLADFEQRLAPGGYLVLGKAETLVAADRRRFRTVCPWERIYRRP
jgi:chemotaxis protein methyltransferase CheR